MLFLGSLQLGRLRQNPNSSAHSRQQEHIQNRVQNNKMSKFDKLEKTKIHTRKINAETYVVDDEHLLVEGVLHDDRKRDSRRSTGEIIPAGTLHHMEIRLLLKLPSLFIEDLEVHIISAPYTECFETSKVMDRMQGVSITSGFSKKVRSLASGPRGCAHLVSLLLVMGQAAFQGYWTHESTRETEGETYSKERLSFLEGTCWAWRKGGKLQQTLLEKSS